MIRIKSAVLQASKVVDIQFHLFVIPSLGQSPFTPPLRSSSSLKNSSMVVGKINLFIKNKKFKYFFCLYPNTSPLVLLLPQPFMFYISPIHIYVLNCIKDSKTKNYIGRKDYFINQTRRKDSNFIVSVKGGWEYPIKLLWVNFLLFVFSLLGLKMLIGCFLTFSLFIVFILFALSNIFTLYINNNINVLIFNDHPSC